MPRAIPTFIRNRLDSERLILRVPQPGDGRMIHASIMESFSELTLWMEWARTAPSLSDSESHIYEMARLMSAREEIGYLIVRRDDGVHVGSIGVHHIAWDVPRFEIGYWGRISMHGHGYITEAVNTLSHYLFAGLSAERVEIRCDARNVRSAAVAERCGFTLEGRMRNERRTHAGALSDSLIYARLRQDYHAAAQQSGRTLG